MAGATVSERNYYAALRSRLVSTRHQLDWSQADMANALGIPLANYKKYEVRSKFPLHLVERLALVTHRDVEYIVTGKNVRQLRSVAAS